MSFSGTIAVFPVRRAVVACSAVLVWGALLAASSSVRAAGGTAPGGTVTVRGRVTRAVIGGPVQSGVAELRWPGRDDSFEPIQSDLSETGAYVLTFAEDAFDGELDELTVSIIAPGFTVAEKPLRGSGVTRRGAAVVDFELTAATVDGVLDIFSCCVLSWSIAIVMLPAFLLGAAVKSFIPSHEFLKYLGPSASKPVAYGAAVGSGMILSLCSCNVVPLFISIWRSGAGIGPAFAFLYAGPAINVVSMVFACRVIGLGIGLWRAVAVAVMSVVVGMVMVQLFGARQHKEPPAPPPPTVAAPAAGPAATVVALLLVLLVLGSIEMSWRLRLCLMLPPAVVTAAVAAFWLDRERCIQWLREAGSLVLHVIPILVPAVIAIGFLAQKIPLSVARWVVGGNSLAVNSLASVVGAFMYFPIMTETAFVKTLLKVMGMGTGPAMALLLTAPGLSLPGMVIVSGEIGLRKLASYVLVLVVLAAVVGMFFGSSWGSYLCSCEYK